ncbi:radical SAM protein, partial [Candidatus Woesearchaeota archaeon]|nr:radical SAM protein [Candidatus Woesearchaeota archaeon]
FCFSDWREQKHELDTEEAKQCIDILSEKGVEAINFTGGEPLMRRDIADILKHSKQKGLRNIVTTNGILLERKLPDIADLVDYVGLPLDSSNPEVHRTMRPTKAVSNHYQLILQLLHLLHEEYSSIGIKINTVVSKKNVGSVMGVGNLIGDVATSWKLSHFSPGGYGSAHSQEFYLPTGRYRKVVARCKATYPHLNIIASEAHTEDDYCRVVSSRGHFLAPTADGLKDLGSILEQPSQHMLKGFNEADNERHLRRTYPLRDL